MIRLSMETRDETTATVQVVNGGGQSGKDIEKVSEYVLKVILIDFADGADTRIPQKSIQENPRFVPLFLEGTNRGVIYRAGDTGKGRIWQLEK